jgi:predicted RNase H-like nuclease (RuvC/YqgF family)
MLDSEKIIQDAIKLHNLEIEKRDIEIKQLKHENDNLKAQLDEAKKEIIMIDGLNLELTDTKNQLRKCVNNIWQAVNNSISSKSKD